MSRSITSARSVAAVLAAQGAVVGGGATRPDAAPGAAARVGTKISARLGLLTARLAATASATFGRIGLGSVEAKVLFCLGSGPQTASGVGKMMGLDRAAVCRAAQTLAERGFVSKAESSARRLSLTPEGEVVLEEVDAIAEARELRLLAGFTAEEKAVVLGMLSRLMLNVPSLDTLAESRVFAAGNDQD